MNAIDPPVAKKRVCWLCGINPVRSDNPLGVCQRTPECNRARQSAQRNRARGLEVTWDDEAGRKARAVLLARLARAMTAATEARRQAEAERKRAALHARLTLARGGRKPDAGAEARLEAARKAHDSMVAARRARGVPADGRPVEWLDDVWALRK